MAFIPISLDEFGAAHLLVLPLPLIGKTGYVWHVQLKHQARLVLFRPIDQLNLPVFNLVPIHWIPLLLPVERLTSQLNLDQ